MMNPVYMVREQEFNEVTCYVRAENEVAAITAAIEADECESFRDSDPADFRVTRMPQFDAVLTEAALVSAGKVWTECMGCNREIHSPTWIEEDGNGDEHDREAFYSPKGGVYCSEACWKTWTTRYPDRDGGEYDAICLYADV